MRTDPGAPGEPRQSANAVCARRQFADKLAGEPRNPIRLETLCAQFKNTVRRQFVVYFADGPHGTRGPEATRARSMQTVCVRRTSADTLADKMHAVSVRGHFGGQTPKPVATQNTLRAVCEQYSSVDCSLTTLRADPQEPADPHQYANAVFEQAASAYCPGGPRRADPEAPCDPKRCARSLRTVCVRRQFPDNYAGGPRKIPAIPNSLLAQSAGSLRSQTVCG